MKYILPKGFFAGGIHCGIKRFKKDLAIIYSKAGCRAVGIFTKNKIKAAPLIVSKAILKKGEPIRAVIINSGNANCCTGWYGARDSKRMIDSVSRALNVRFNNVLVSSTGVIGKRLPIEIIEDGIQELAGRLSEKGLLSAAYAILTTDRRVKIAVQKVIIDKKEIILSGIVKGAGMIHPNMATMLSFIMTDANIDKDALKLALKEASACSFNAISVDGDMSTNDTVLLLANALAGNRTIKRNTKEYDLFLKALKYMCFKLARDIVEDGEGATKFVTVHVKNAPSEKDAEKIARAIANSCLVKTSIFGESPNWGRVASSVGQSGANGIKPNKIEIYLDRVCMFKRGGFTQVSQEKKGKIYKRKTAEILVNLNAGSKEAKIWTCDLSKRYVEINAHYLS